MTYPENLKYAKSHEWVEFLEDGSARIGMTDYAPVSYTHLDVYKRQALGLQGMRKRGQRPNAVRSSQSIRPP